MLQNNAIKGVYFKLHEASLKKAWGASVEEPKNQRRQEPLNEPIVTESMARLTEPVKDKKKKAPKGFHEPYTSG